MDSTSSPRVRWAMVRPGVLRLTYSDGAFFAEYTIADRKLLAVNRGGTVAFDLRQIEEEIQETAN